MWSLLAQALFVVVWLGGGGQVFADDAKPAPKQAPPEVRELWVPSEQLDSVLKKYPRAVLLTGEQYAALLRDSGVDDNEEELQKPPVAAVVGEVVMSGQLHDEVAVIRALYRVQSFDEDWSKIPLALPRKHLAKISVDGEGVGAVRPFIGDNAKAKSDLVQLLVSGAGEHRVSAEFHLPITSDATGNSIQITSPGIAAGRLDLKIAAGIELDSALPFSVQAAAAPGGQAVAQFALPAAQGFHEIRWAARDIASIPDAAIFQNCRYLYSINAARVQGDLGMVLSSSLTDLPNAFTIVLPTQVRVLSVEGGELLSWDRDDKGVVAVKLVAGKRKAADLRLLVESPIAIDDASGLATIALPVAEVDGVHRASGTLALIGSEDVKVQSVETGALTVPSRDELAAPIRDHAHFVTGFRFPVLAEAPTVTLSPVTQRFNAQLDTAIQLERDAIRLRRELSISPLEGRIFETNIALPDGEEISRVSWKDAAQSQSEGQLQWTRSDGGKGVRIEWAGGLEPGGGRSLVIETRRDPEQWFDLGNEAVELDFSSAVVTGAEAVSGYVAVDFDESFRIETVSVDGLEARDARGTPVKGRLAWFRLSDYDLKLAAARRSAEIEAELTAYALPLQNSLELEGELALTIRHTPVAGLVVKLPPAVAAQMHFESAMIAEKSLDEESGEWTLTFHDERIGRQVLRFHGSVGYDLEAATADAANVSGEVGFDVEVPVLAVVGANRIHGQWLVEANTDTELTFSPRGMDEFDLLNAPRAGSYTPRHRVVAAYAFRGEDYQLNISGTRHQAAAMITAVVDALRIDSVLSVDGLDRHQARIKLRTAGEQFLEVGLPNGAELWTLTVDGEAVKPVTAKSGTLRIALPADSQGRAEVDIKLVYQLRRDSWDGSGRRELQPVRLSKHLPVLRSEWLLHLPEGFDYQRFKSNLNQRFEIVDRTLLGEASREWGRWVEHIGSADLMTDAAGNRRATAAKQIESGWELAEPAAASQDSMVTTIASDGSSGVAVIEEKLKNIIIPTVDFKDTPLSSALEFLTQKSAELDRAEPDPAKKGIGMILQAGTNQLMQMAPSGSGAATFDNPDTSGSNSIADTPITLKLRNVPLVEALRYTTSLAQLKYKVEPHAVVVVPLSTPDSDLYTNVYRVPPTFLGSVNAGGGGGAGPVDPFAPAPDSGSTLSARPDARQILERAGVTFGEGSSAIYNSATGQLIVRNTGDQMELTEAMIDSLKDSGDPDLDLKKLELPSGNELTGEDLGAFRGLYESEDEFRRSVNADNDPAVARNEQKLAQTILPSVDFSEMSLREAVDFLEDKIGMPIKIEGGHAADGAAPADGRRVEDTEITLKLSNVPATEAVRYTSNLAQLDFKVTASGVVIRPRHAPADLKTLVVEVPQSFFSNGVDSPPLTPRQFFERAGITFAQGAGAFYNTSTQRLAVKNTEDQMQLIEAYLASANYYIDRSGSGVGRLGGVRGESVAGLIPIDFELPEAGRSYRFEGLYAPEPIRFRYVDWERQVRIAWWWIAFGCLLYCIAAVRSGRPWFVALIGVLVLNFVPLALLPSLTSVCNALLIGWLLAIGLRLLWRVVLVMQRWQRRSQAQLRADAEVAMRKLHGEGAS